MNGPRLNRIGHPMKITWEFFFWISNTIFLGTGFIKNLVFANNGVKMKAQRPYTICEGFWICVYKLAVLASCSAMPIYCWIRILTLKIWVRHSNWFEKLPNGDNPEDQWNGIDQPAPLLVFFGSRYRILRPLYLQASSFPRPEARCLE